MAENNQKIKLLRIIEYLRAESDAGKPVSTSQIIGYLNSIHISRERRTLYKDMDALESGVTTFLQTGVQSGTVGVTT